MAGPNERPQPLDPVREGWRDEPITSESQDRLGRAPVARRAAELIHRNHSSDASVVYGLEGAWGSGKSSVIALVTTYLQEDGARWQIVTFTPWATTGTDGLFSEFFAALSTLRSEDKKSLQKIVKEYADIAGPFLSMIPVAGKAASDLTSNLAKRLEKPWNVAFEEMATALRELGTPVLVVVDDIDRLQSNELLDLLKVVRLLGRFPGVDFLLAYDEETLVETLQKSGSGAGSRARARAFMEKIVQYPVSLPPLLTSQIVRLVDAGLEEILKSHDLQESAFEKDRFGPVILGTMPRQLTTPRAIERFLAQVREEFRAHDLAEVNAVDLILSTFLRVQFPDVYARLQTWKTDLTRVDYFVRSRRGEQEQPDWTSLVAALERAEDQTDALTVLGVVFPVIRDRQRAQARAGRFAHPDYFDRYLAQGIPQGDIPDSGVAVALQQASSGREDELRALLLDADRDRSMLALTKIAARYPDISEMKYHAGPQGPLTRDLLASAMTLIQEMEEDSKTSVITTYDQLRWWASTLLRRLLHDDPTLDVDPALLRCTRIEPRAHVISTATHNVDELDARTRQALSDTLDREVGRILPQLLADLRLRDESAEDLGATFLYSLVTQSSRLDDFRHCIKQGVDAGEFTVEDVAARLVSFGYLVGVERERPSGASFSSELFTSLTDTSATSGDYRTTGEWTDTGWPRRREFAAQFIDLTPEEASKGARVAGNEPEGPDA